MTKYISALEVIGAQVEVFSARYTAADFARSIVKCGAAVRSFPPHSWLGDALTRFPLLWRLGPRLTSWSPNPDYLRQLFGTSSDIYIAGDPDLLQLGLRMKRKKSARLVYVPFEYFPEHSSAGGPLCKRWRGLERRIAPHVDAWISLGDKLSEEYARQYCVGGPITTVYSGLPRDGTIMEPRLRARLKLPAETVLILYQGYVSRKRGIWDVLEAFRALPLHVHFAILGFGEELEMLRAEVAGGELAARVHILDAVPQEELLAYTRDADIGIIPIHGAGASYRLCNPGKLFEYMAAGVPIVTSNLEQVGWYVRENRLGEVYANQDIDSLVRAIGRLVDSPSHRRACAQRCLQTHRDSACWEVHGSRFVNAVLG